MTEVEVRVGDTIEVLSNRVGQPARRGTVKEILAEESLELRVQWDDEHESMYRPAAGMARVVERAKG